MVLLTCAGALHAQFYAVTDLGTLGGTNCIAYGINNREQIVGTSQTGTGQYHAYMFEGGRMLDLGTMGGSNSWAFGISEGGWMVGTSELWPTNTHAFLCTNAVAGSAMMDLGTLGGSNSVAWMVNMHGDVVGWAAMADGSHHAFFMTNGTPFHMMDLGTAGGTNSEAYCINSNRMVVGSTMMADGRMEPIMSTNAMLGGSGMMTMDMGGMGALGGQFWFINELGTSVGEAHMSGGNHHAVLSRPGGMMGHMEVDLGTLGGSNSTAYCVNNAGSVVGSAQTTNGTMHAFLLTNASGGMVRMIDLNGFIPTNSGWELRVARGINAAGQIVGWGMHAGHTNAFLLTPVAGPTHMIGGPLPQVVGDGAAVALTMNMMASEPLSYQWMHDGTTIPQATNAILNLAGMGPETAGRYSVVVRNTVGTVATASAAVCMFGAGFTDGHPHLMVAAPAGAHFRIDSSDALGPASDWQYMTNFTVVGSTLQIADPSMAGSRARFYRAVMLP